VSFKSRCEQAEDSFWLKEYQAWRQWLEGAPEAETRAFYDEVLLRLREAGIQTLEPEALWSLPEEEQDAELRRLQASYEEQVISATLETWAFKAWQRSSAEAAGQSA